MGDEDWDQPRQGDLGEAHRSAPRTGPKRPSTGRLATPGRGTPPPGATDPTELMQGAGHFDGVTFADEADRATDVIVPKLGSTAQRSTHRSMTRRIATATGYAVLGLVSLLVLGITGYAWGTYDTFDTGVHRSDALISPTEKKSLNGDTNILIMGLDSRLDENGKPLPQNIYNALHAGDNSVGGYNANVLMLLHVPAHGQAVEISIPRDDYVNLPGCPDGVCKEKIKQAYGLARDQAYNRLVARGVRGADLEQQARDAGRKEEADTVSQFLGGIPIDHFIEVTLVAFFQIAQVVAPITVCVLKTTHDTFSGANFHAGMQRITAAQALAYVRQRRDNVKGDFYYHNFTDLDRERRQQAFISSLAYQLRQAGTFTSPTKISGILNVAKQNTAIDSGLNLLDFAQEASNLTGGHITFNTLPVERFVDLGGSVGDVNMVNVPVIQAEVKQWLGIKSPATPATAPAAPPGATGVVDVVNRSGQSGAAGRLEQALVAKGFTQGDASTESVETSTVVEYGSSGAHAAANAVAGLLGGDVTVERSTRAAVGRVRVVLGSSFAMPAALGGSGSNAPTPDAAALKNEAPGSNANAPSPLAGGSIPCVK